MINSKKVVCLITICAGYTGYAFSQNPTSPSVSLNKMGAFNKPGENWITVSEISSDLSKIQNTKYTKGDGIILNTSKKDGSDLVSSQEFGDTEFDADFMLFKSSASSIYLQGRYGIKLRDSWANRNATLADLGAIEPIVDAQGRGYGGNAPLLNVAKAPGLWQHIKIKFRAPVFDGGAKVKNARIEEVSVNGVVVQLENELNAPTGHSTFKDEKALGPLIIKGDGGSIALRNITYTPLRPLQTPTFSNPLSRRRAPTVNPIILLPKNQPYLLRSFLMFNNVKRTHVISLGDPNELNFSYDLKQGALFQIWRGQFLDVTEMWENRGEPQLAKPLGSVLPLSINPAIALLEKDEAVWPDSIAFDDLQNKGYTLDKNRMPTFEYSYAGADVTDKISTQENGQSVLRLVTILNAPDKLYFRIAAAPIIKKNENGMYAIANAMYYVKVEDGTKPIIRNAQNGQELIIPLKKGSNTLSYSLIW